ncbi:hypothetical protein SAMN05660484_00985 [Eubacterium ruminantium]|uniref:DUF1887 domain-containing protein n=2 Tax=Eubacterium ruminantium TaxID=42322 RepID=A0A1T4L544_9FIRM|nr:hypothetical protein [Eubacterium ruminantium]SCW43314.1 hypothetical protein SAMN05660484_00985 [Eubacterium ruminantium]SJZ49671.1 hypothetical protein SAMN02745110_00665 [Eubacterium ruminantium]
MSGTFVEFFSEEALENVMVILKYKPDRVVYVGHKSNMITKKINSLRAFVARTSPNTELKFVEVSRDNLDQIIDTLMELVEKYKDAKFELTGGGELILIAFGFVSSKIPVETLRIDPYTGTEIDFSGSTPTRSASHIQMSVADNMVLHGGSLTNLTGSYSTWKFTDDFRNDIRAIWEIAKSIKSKWNKCTANIEEVVKNFPPDETGLYTLPRSGLGEATELLFKLKNIGVVKDLYIAKRTVSFYFKNEMIRHVVTKTGNILELHVYDVATSNNSKFTDAVIGAMIDWNGDNDKKPFEEQQQQYDNSTNIDTINEIDVILMRDTIPTFISCKSGKVGSVALHELQTVTSRFGGKYALKVLVMATPCDNSSSGVSFFKQRAKDMHIWVIDDVYSMSDEALRQKLLKIQGISIN